jgi:hypothetical protein
LNFFQKIKNFQKTILNISKYFTQNGENLPLKNSQKSFPLADLPIYWLQAGIGFTFSIL